MTIRAKSAMGAYGDALRTQRLMPILTLDSVDHGLRVADVLAEGGFKTFELTLRTGNALAAIAAIVKQHPTLNVGAGTVLTRDQLQAAADAGAVFAVSPGANLELLRIAADGPLPFVPGVGTVSEAMTATDHGFDLLKFFPAEAAGGVPFLKAIAGPLPNMRFCPTGGITAQAVANYLALSNVVAVGGSWVAPDALIRDGKFDEIAKLAKDAKALIKG
jgi:2-dehydro-3-deoxyphosphogluconate aldolase/(4S)-4-hydroxy-2-oxoglutarate aldolase